MTTPSTGAALDTFLNVFDGYTLRDLGPHLTCTEADVLADLFKAYGLTDKAEALIQGHAAEDDEGDRHHPDYQED